MRILCITKDSHIFVDFFFLFSQQQQKKKKRKKKKVFVMLPIEKFNESLTNDIVNFKHLGPVVLLISRSKLSDLSFHITSEYQMRRAFISIINK